MKQKNILSTFIRMVLISVFVLASLPVFAQEAKIQKDPRPMNPPHIKAGFVEGSNCSVVWIQWERKNDVAVKYQIEYSWIKKTNPPMEKFSNPVNYTAGQKDYYITFLVPQKNRNSSDKLHVRIVIFDANNDFIPSNTVPLKCDGEPDFEHWEECEPSSTSALPGEIINFHVQGSSTYGIKKIVIDYDDGSQKESTSTSDYFFTHAYAEEGEYQPEATFIDNEGHSFTVSCCVITVSETPDPTDCTIEHLKSVVGFHAIYTDGRDFIRVYWEAEHLNPNIEYLVFKSMYAWKDFHENGDHKIKKRIGEEEYFSGADEINKFDDFDLELNDTYNFDKGLVVVYTIIARCGNNCNKDRIVGGVTVMIEPAKD